MSNTVGITTGGCVSDSYVPNEKRSELGGISNTVGRTMGGCVYDSHVSTEERSELEGM